MKIFRQLFFLLIPVFMLKNMHAQELSTDFTFEEYIGYVKAHHPVMKQANLTLSAGEANLLSARGAFDPKVEVDFDRKKFKNTLYYEQLNTAFKIPTWYGVEFKAGFEDNTGEYLNPMATIPEEGLYSAGVSFSLAQGFLINERMANLKQARFFRNQSNAERDLIVVNLLYEASNAYFDWLEATNERDIYSRFLENSTERLAAIQRSVEEGDKAAIDITEARIIVQNRALALEAAILKSRKAALQVSNYLWMNDIPLLLEDQVEPAWPSLDLLYPDGFLFNEDNLQNLVADHPKIRSLFFKIDGLEVDRNLKLNKLLPKVDVQYNFLAADYEPLSQFTSANYKAYVDISFPIFLRKERGNLRLANYKIQDAQFEQKLTTLTITNKIAEISFEIESLETQNDLINSIVADYQRMVEAEERKFFLGESSLFLINSREQQLIDSQLKENALLIKQLNAVAGLNKALGISDYQLN